MRRFSSYGPIDTDLHYYAPRKALLAHAYTQLMGEEPEKGGHYITVWAPRQTGKSWTMQQILFKLRQDERFDAVKINLETVKTETDLSVVLSYISTKLTGWLGKEPVQATTANEFEELFTRDALGKPLVLILDEFDALQEHIISGVVGVFATFTPVVAMIRALRRKKHIGCMVWP
jgi:Cdc6-like AAA superfamily ATPase